MTSSRVNRHQTKELEIQLLREGIVEATHLAHVAVCDGRGRTLSVAGNGELGTFIRSALKPFQALAVTAAGALERYSLGDRDLAIMCGSHQGTIEQARQAFHILWQADLDPTALRCPIPAGKKSPLEHNCSGKHAGMLAVCQQRNWPLATYLDRSHPIQKLILTRISELLGMPSDEFICAHDDCGAPTYFMQLSQMASLFAMLSSGNNLDMERIVRAMISNPDMVGGPGSFDTTLMNLTHGALVSKSGAEGIQCIGRVGEGLGLSIKVIDGARRAKYATAIFTLRQLGWITPTVADTLAETYMKVGDFTRLDVVGDLPMMY
ncbi:MULTISPECIES: asparaginase [Cyanophyceae]|uniref:asparaginase n=1 Tax=Cyanophyceae TaxID=3028117 RepID=UPI001684D6B8|nr:MULTISPECIES: asparaginase [Cyanophyceae]MBD1917561.1 asparaginase [Phormidium sp. FACHB-77]MBD2029564.1 asparaginase [Phormidium sp. FACHB-322]MBD2050825.1 asparaginase [Leptolyngbya sp. FACHB-60]